MTEEKENTIKDQNNNPEIEILKERLKRAQADIDNYRKMIASKIQEIQDHANEDLIKKLLPIIDDLERAIPKMQNEEDKRGIKMILDNFLKILKEEGLKEIPTKDTNFDPFLHEALIQEEGDYPEGKILEELQKGYTFKNHVIRYAKVKVSKPKEVVENGN